MNMKEIFMIVFIFGALFGIAVSSFADWAAGKIQIRMNNKNKVPEITTYNENPWNIIYKENK